MSIKDNIKFCGTTNIPEGSRIEIIKGYSDLVGARGTASDPIGLYKSSRGYISIKLDDNQMKLKQVNIKAAEVKILN